MNPGTLDRRLSAQLLVSDDGTLTDESGAAMTDESGTALDSEGPPRRFNEPASDVSGTWTHQFYLWARKLPGRGTEREENGKEAGKQTVTFRARYNSALTRKHRLAYQGENYDVLSITEGGRRDYMDIETEVYTDGGAV